MNQDSSATQVASETGINMEMPYLDGKNKKDFGDALVNIAVRQLSVSNQYKEPLLEKWKMFEDLKAGKTKKKLRSQFNIVLPVFSGMLDTLSADFDEPVELEFKKKHPADYFKATKYQAAWNMEKNNSHKDAKWDYKSRIDKSLNILHGRSFLKEFAFSNPKYHNVLENADPIDMHTQPKGGGMLENHLFSGQEAILRTEGEIELGVLSGLYDKEQFKILKQKSGNPDYVLDVTENAAQKLARFKALGLDPENHSYIGEKTYNLCEWVLTYKGKRWYVLFDPWTLTWLRYDKLSNIYSKDLYPWCSWATHEDNKVFWSKAFADDIFYVADAINTLFNQELTNREKQNNNARAYDKDIFTDVAKLDQAQYRPDALVPVDTKGGTRKISEGIYSFQVNELQGTINLLDYVDKSIEKKTGVNDISQGAAVEATKKVNVAYLEQGAIAKRIGHKSQSYTECWGEIGLRFIQGLKDHMTGDMYIEVLGDMGIEPDVLTRDDLHTEADLGVEVVSSTARKQESKAKREGKIKALEMLQQSQNLNSEWKDAAILRYVGEFDEDEIKLALDTKNYASRESVAKAHIAIQELLASEKPELNYAADATFLKVIFDYMMEHRNKLGVERGKQFTQYIADHAQLAQQNAMRNGKQRGIQNARRQMINQSMKPAGNAKVAPQPIPENAQAMQ